MSLKLLFEKKTIKYVQSNLGIIILFKDADDESEGDSDSVNACNGQVTGEGSRSQTPNEKNDSTGANNDESEAQSTTFVPIKVEEKEEEPEATENNEITPPSSPDIPDDPAICSKIAVRFKHKETQAGNSCSRCEMVYIHEGPRKKKPVEIEVVFLVSNVLFRQLGRS